MNQDGSDDQPTVGVPRNNDKVVPRAMWLRLLDSNKKEIDSELVSFAHSYEEAVLCALGAFPMHLDETTRESISLKYYVRSKDAQFSWVGLRAARGSKEMWSYLVVDGSEVAEIGVLVDKKQGRTLEPIHGMDGQPIVAYFEAGTGLKTVVEVNCTDVPPNYEDCLDYAAQIVSSPPFPNLDSQKLRRRLRLNIWDSAEQKYLRFAPSEYRAVVESYAYTSDGLLTVFIQVCMIG